MPHRYHQVVMLRRQRRLHGTIQEAQRFGNTVATDALAGLQNWGTEGTVAAVNTRACVILGVTC